MVSEPKPTFDDPDASAPDPALIAERLDVPMYLADAGSQSYRVAVALRCMYDFQFDEIAMVLGVSMPYVRHLVCSGLKRIRRKTDCHALRRDLRYGNFRSRFNA